MKAVTERAKKSALPSNICPGALLITELSTQTRLGLKSYYLNLTLSSPKTDDITVVLSTRISIAKLDCVIEDHINLQNSLYGKNGSTFSFLDYMKQQRNGSPHKSQAPHGHINIGSELTSPGYLT